MSGAFDKEYFIILQNNGIHSCVPETGLATVFKFAVNHGAIVAPEI